MKKYVLFVLVACALILMVGYSSAARSTTLTTEDVSDITPDYVKQEDTYVPIISFTLNDSATETFTSAIVTYTGTNRNDVSSVMLFAEKDGGSGTFDKSDDIFLGGTSIWIGSPPEATISLSYTLQKDKSYKFYVVFNISTTAVDGNSIDAKISVDALTVGGNTWPDNDYDPLGYSIVDANPPSTSITSPADGSTISELNSITGTSSDLLSGVAYVDIYIKRNSDDKYWDGLRWTSSLIWLRASGTTSWSRTSQLPIWKSGETYIIGARAVDNVGNVELPKTSTFNYVSRSTTLTTVSFSDMTPDWIKNGDGKVPILTFTIKDSITEEFQSIKVTYNGTSKNDVPTVYIYQEKTGNGKFNADSDTLLSSSSSWDGNIITLLPGITLNADTNYQFYIVVDVSSSASTNSIIDLLVEEDAMRIGSYTWPDSPYDPSGVSKVDATLPGDWINFSPTTWHTTSQTPSCNIQVRDLHSGLSVNSAEYSYSTDGGSTWSSWLSASCTGTDGTTSTETITASNVPFNQDSLNNNKIKFRISDIAGNTATSPEYIVKIDTNSPNGWSLVLPTDWVTNTQSPNVKITASDITSGLDVSSAEYSYSTDGGSTWSSWLSASCTGTDGTTSTETITASNVPFNQDSLNNNKIKFRMSDVAGNTATSPEYIVKIDTTPPKNWTFIYPLSWVNNTKRPNVKINVSDYVSGLDVSKAYYMYSNDGGKNWVWWTLASCTGTTGTTLPQMITASGVPFDSDSQNKNLIKFKIYDVAGNIAYSPIYVIKIDTTKPSNWNLLSPIGWWKSSQIVSVNASLNDSTSGLKISTAQYRFSRDGGITWTPWFNASCTGSDGSTLYETITAANVQFNQDSSNLNQIMFRISDVAGNWNVSTSYIIMIDTEKPTNFELWHPKSWHIINQTPNVSINLSDKTSGISKVLYSYSTDGGMTWSDWYDCAYYGENGSTNKETVTAISVQFNKDSADKNYIKFKAYDVAGNFNISTSYLIKIDTIPPVAPKMILEPKFTSGYENNVSWTRGHDDTSGIAYYLCECDDSSAFDSIDATSGWINKTHFIFRELKDGITYYYRVKVRDVAGHESAYSQIVCSTQDASPPKTPKMIPEPKFTKGTENEVMCEVSEDSGVGGVEYNFICAEDRDFKKIVAYSGWIKDNKYIFTDLKDGKKYFYRVLVKDALGNTNEPSGYVYSTQDASPPDVPKMLEEPLFTRGNENTVKCTIVKDSVEGSVYYNFSCSIYSNFNEIYQFSGWITSAQYTFTNLAEGVKYYYRVEVMDGLENSIFSENYVESVQDYSPPHVKISTDPDSPNGKNGWYVSTVYLYINAKDNISGVDKIEYILNGIKKRYTDRIIIESGVYMLKYYVEDKVGNVLQGEISLKIDTKLPTVKIDGNETAYTHEVMMFRAICNDENGISSIKWDFGDGACADGEMIVHSYEKPGKYIVKLTVEDIAGNSNTSFIIISIYSKSENYPPEPVIDVKIPIYAYEKTTFDASKTKDEKIESLRYIWDFGDYTTAEGKTVEHVYKKTGEYTVKLTAIDEEGLSATVMLQIRVYERGKNMPPLAVIEYSPDVIYTNDVVAFDGTRSSDEMPEKLRFEWTIGEESYEGSIVKHVFKRSGNVKVILKVTDINGLSSTTNVTIFVYERGKNLPPTIYINVPREVHVNENVIFDASNTTDENKMSLNVTWYFGDGEMSHGMRVKHKYEKPGDYNVSVVVRDEGGLTSETNFYIKVLPMGKVVEGEENGIIYGIFAAILLTSLMIGMAYTIFRRRKSVAEMIDDEKSEEKDELIEAPNKIVEPHLNHIYFEKHPSKCYEMMKNTAEENRNFRFLCLVTTHPTKIARRYALTGENFEFYWVTESTSYDNVLSPSRMDYEMTETITEFIKEHEKNAVVFLDCVESLIHTHEIERVLDFLTSINNLASTKESTVIIDINPKAIDDESLNKIIKIFDDVEDLEKSNEP